jgi:hypothetical protein
MREEELEVAIKVSITLCTHIQSIRLIGNVAFDHKTGTNVAARAMMVHGDSRGTAPLILNGVTRWEVSGK